jgi:hypothetical protein
VLARLSLVLAVVVFALSLPFASATPANAQSYPLTCRIGKMNGMAMDNGLYLVPFTKGTGLVAAGVQPGSCAWLDRAFKPSEPSALCAKGTVVNLAFTNGVVVQNSTTFGGPGGTLLQTAVFGPTTLMSFTVHATTGLLACLMIDSYGP